MRRWRFFNTFRKIIMGVMLSMGGVFIGNFHAETVIDETQGEIDWVSFQGNRLSQQRLGQIRLGISKLQVQEILGKSLVQVPFPSQIWYYVELRKKDCRSPEMQETVCILHFDELQRIDYFSVERWQDDHLIFFEKVPT